MEMVKCRFCQRSYDVRVIKVHERFCQFKLSDREESEWAQSDST